jgi:hypothetical protein
MPFEVTCSHSFLTTTQIFFSNTKLFWEGFINLYNNSFSGSLPSNWNLGYLFYLDLGFNSLTGSIPSDWVTGINSMARLRLLYLNNNQLTGSMPQYFPSIGMERLETFAINDNQLTGSFEFLMNYTYNSFLTDLRIQRNSFTGISEDVCGLSIFTGGQMVNLEADCSACTCLNFCSPDLCTV